jgi:predicted nucleic acid-binding protein
VDEFRLVIDAQIVLSMFLVRRDRPEEVSPKRRLLRLLAMPSVQWLWTPDIIADYESGAWAIENNQKLIARAAFDRTGFTLFTQALRFHRKVNVSAETMKRARRRLEQAVKAKDRDLDDAVYLACAVDGEAFLLVSKDSDLRALGAEYEGVLIAGWQRLEEELLARGIEL